MRKYITAALCALMLAGTVGCASKPATTEPASTEQTEVTSTEGIEATSDGSAAAAQEADVVVDNGRMGVHATVTVPSEGENWPLVVLCHGYVGDRSGMGIFPVVAEQLASQGIASIRLDFPGCGESEETQAEYTIANMTADVNACITYMVDTYGIDQAKIGMAGHSMGGRITSLYTDSADAQYPVKAIALMSPADGEGDHALEFLAIMDVEGADALADQAVTEGQIALEMWGVDLYADYVNEMRATTPTKSVAAFEGPVLLTYTGNEFVISDETKAAVIDVVEAKDNGTVETEAFLDATHGYTTVDEENAETRNPELLEAVTTLVSGFMAENL